MLISDMIGQLGGQNVNGGNKNTATASLRFAESTKSGDTSLSSFKPGEVFEGTVSDIKDDKVTISLSNGKTLMARIEGAVPMNQGQSVFFEVRSNEGGTIKISPMPDDDFSNPILNDALKNAGLPITANNLSLVKEMMNNGISINADNLGRMGRIVNTNSSVDISTIINMDKMGIKITPDNISNFTRLEENNNALLKEADNITSSISKMFESSGMSGESIVDFENTILSSLDKLSNGKNVLPTGSGVDTIVNLSESVTDGVKTDQNSENVLNKDLTGLLTETRSDTVDATTILGKQDVTSALQQQGNVIVTNNVDGEKETVNNQPVKSESNINIADEIIINDSAENKPEDSASKTLQSNTDNVLEKSNLSGDMVKVSDELSKLPGFKDSNQQIFDENGNLKPTVSGKELLETAVSFFKDNPEIARDHAKSFFSGKEYNNILSDIMKGDWSLNPDQVSSKDVVKELYKNLEKQLDTINNIAKNFSGNNNPVSDAINSAKGNVDFINQLNQMYSYVQIPLKMMNQNATGDLYVYTDKRKKGGKSSDSLTAFLHLSLDKLGNVDIAVKLNRKNAEVKFYMDNDSSYKLVMDNKDILIDRLAKKGYTSKIEVSEESQPENFVEKFLNESLGNSTSHDIKRFSFDVRA